MGFVQGLNLAPLAFIMTAAVFRSMDPSLEEAAQVHGAGPLRVLRRITVRLAWPGIMAASIYVFMTAFAAFDVPAIIGWGNRIFTFSTYLYLLLNPQDVLPQYGLAAALSTMALVIAAHWRAGGTADAAALAPLCGGHRRAYRPKLAPLGRRAIGAWCFIGAYLLLSQGHADPAARLCVGTAVLPAAERVCVLDHVAVALPHAAVGACVPRGRQHTCPGRAGADVTLAISLAFSWVVLRSRIPGRAGFDFIAFLPHAVPSIIFGVGALLLTLFVLQRALPLYGTIWILLIVFVIARISYGTRMTNSGLIQIHAELEESAQMSGASTWDAFRRVTMPLLAPTLLYAWLWIALLTFRELTLAVILSTAENVTFPVVVWSLWLGGGLGQASALAMVMLVMMTPLIALYWLIARRQGLVAD